MLGAALALAWASPLRERYASAWLRVRRPALAVAVAVLAALVVLLREDGPATFRGGVALASLASVMLVAALLPVTADGPEAGDSRWRAALTPAPMQWVGRRSYGIYLWHWPVVVILGRDLPSAPGTYQHVVTALWCVLVTVAVADLSYRFVEAPVRVWGFRACAVMAWTAVRRGVPLAPARFAAAAGVLVLVAATAVVVTAPQATRTQELLEQDEAAAAAGPAPTAPTPTAASAAPAAPPQSWAMPAGDEIDIVGDSLVVTTKDALQYYFPGVRLDAVSNRRWSDGLAAVTARGADARRAVVLGFGTNAGVDEEVVTQVLDRLGPDRMVVLVNLYDPRSTFIGSSNAALSALAEPRPNVIVADWHAAIAAQPSLLQSDRTHPTITGAHLFAKTVRAALAELSTRHTGRAVDLPELKAY
jgi:lysophospholipase L1-like esterase